MVLLNPNPWYFIAGQVYNFGTEKLVSFKESQTLGVQYSDTLLSNDLKLLPISLAGS